MIKADIVNKVAEISQISRVKAAQAVDTVIEGLRNALARGQRIELRGFGVFQVKQRKKGIGRNPENRSGSEDPARKHDPLQAGQRAPQPSVTKSSICHEHEGRRNGVLSFA